MKAFRTIWHDPELVKVFNKPAEDKELVTIDGS